MSHGKYRAKPVTFDGYRFASQMEWRRYLQLKILSQNGNIKELKLQPRFDLTINGHKICTYVADFSYQENGTEIVEDVKGVETPVFKLKRKLMRALLGIELRLTH